MNGNRKNIYLILGLIIIFYGLSFPASVYDWTGNLYEMIEDSILYNDAGLLLKASFFYITWNVFTFMMIYSGSMLMAMAVSTDKNSPYYQLSFALIVLLNVFIYNMIYSEHESFLLHMVISAAFLLLQLFIPKQPFSVLPQLIILFLILVSFSWLDLSPGLTRADLGSDDFAASLKVADSYLSEYKILNNLSLSFFFVFSILSLIFTVLIYLFSKQILTIKKVQKQEKELKETRDALLETNVYKEIHTLVHDLKTPLVTVEGLISLLELKVTQDEKASTYFNKINAATAKMKEMISEILSEDIKQEIGVEDFIGYVTSHISFDHVQIDFNLTIDEHVSPIKVNKIRFARALSNVIENAMLSLGDQKGYIHLEVEGIDNGVLFRVEDNGPGIEKRNMNKIWEEGFSTKNSSGVGMPFVKQVVENHQGAIRVSSIPNEKTTVEIFLPY
ncbi:MAG: HAMP domain-containing histidine kinase [Bacillaceae bacterium]|nr:HAMP domain-containing histidine kinase [Bacillaceae bacterium]